jgi:small subunit ribosomal protein S6
LKKAEVEPSIMMKEVQREEARKVAQADAPAAAY